MNVDDRAEQGIGTQLLAGRSSRWQAFLLLVAITASSYAQVTLSPLQEAVKAALRLSDNQMAVLQGPAMALPMVLAAIPLGMLMHRYSRVRLLLLLALSNLVGNLLTSQATNFAQLTVLRAVIGLTTIAVNPIALSLVADMFLETQRGRATMLMSLGQVVGTAASYGLGGLLLSVFGATPQGWRPALIGLSLPLFIAIFAAFAMREPGQSHAHQANSAFSSDQFTALWAHRGAVIPLLMGVVITQVAMGAPLIWTVPAFSRHYALTPERIGAIMATVLLISGVVGPVIGGVVADACQRLGGSRRTLGTLVAVAFACAPFGLFALTPGAPSAIVAMCVFMTMIMAVSVMGTTLFTVVAPEGGRGLCMGVFAGASVLFSVGLAPILVSVLSDFLGGPGQIGHALAFVCVSSCILGAAVLSAGLRYFPAAVSA